MSNLPQSQEDAFEKDQNEQPESQNPSRRKALKTIAALTGAAALSTLPAKWSHPNAKIGTLPAFAQASPTPTPTLGTGDLQVTLTWDAGDLNAPNCAGGGRDQGAVDVDLHVVEPDGTRVYFANRAGPTATLDVDNQQGFGPENIFVSSGQVASGTYRVQVNYFCGAPTTTATIRIVVFANTANEMVTTFTRTLTDDDTSVLFNVADISYPGGTVTEVTGQQVQAGTALATKN